jgi:putative solute:sodium symporter small subunit
MVSRGQEETCQKGGHALSDKEAATAYWKTNVRIILWSLVIWALVSFGFGILLRPMLSGIAVGGTDLGFWFAQQGSILVFLALIFFYAWRMNKLDAEHGVGEE